MKPEEAHLIIMKIYKDLLNRKPDKRGYLNYLYKLINDNKTEEWMYNDVENSKERREIIARDKFLKRMEEIKIKKEEDERKKIREMEEKRKIKIENETMMMEDKYYLNNNITKKDEIIIGGMTTIPSRINDLKATINSIKNQIYPISKLILTIPYALKRNGQTYNIPKWIEDDDFIHILRMDDFGPVCKLLGPLEYSRNPNTIIITFDDDTIYSDDTVKNLMIGYMIYPNAAFATSSLQFRMIKGNPQFKTQYIPGPTRILEGWGGALYKRSFFNKDIHDMLPNSYHCFFSDDLIISNYLRKHNIPLIKVQRPKSLGVRDISNIDALRTGANGLTYRTFNRYRLAVMELRYLNKLYL